VEKMAQSDCSLSTLGDMEREQEGETNDNGSDMGFLQLKAERRAGAWKLLPMGDLQPPKSIHP